MDLNISDPRQLDDGVTVLNLSGRITLGESAGKLRDAIIKCEGEGCKKLILNCDKVSDIDSAGIGELLSGLRKLKFVGGEIKLVGIEKRGVICFRL